jgi:hypothetical protein
MTMSPVQHVGSGPAAVRRPILGQVVAGAARTASSARASWFSQIGNREERAQLLARRSAEIASRYSDETSTEAVLEIMRSARSDIAMLEHALVACRTLVRDDPANEQVTRAVRLLERATMFLGVRPQPLEARNATRQLGDKPLRTDPSARVLGIRRPSQSRG